MEGALHYLCSQNGRLRLLEDFDHLLQARHFGLDDVIRQNHRKRFVAHQVAGHKNCVSQAHGLLLPHIRDARHMRYLSRHGQQFGLAPLLEQLFQLKADVEVVFDFRLVSAGNDDDLFAACGDCLFHAVLDQRLVYQRQHLLGQRFGRRQEPCAEAGRRENCFAHSVFHLLQSFTPLRLVSLKRIRWMQQQLQCRRIIPQKGAAHDANGRESLFEKVIVELLQRKMRALLLLQICSQFENLQLAQSVIEIACIGCPALGFD